MTTLDLDCFKTSTTLSIWDGLFNSSEKSTV
eukprot:CAMPEP_0115168852 /NCGR_PEP_ID=MMETSP0270-20121206/968_1 /TAXON_ID=71861 /ORGANISM="Scrippsiella trochoidea, Strain CCMP3099" /LENGTH=30 /DNA_ID= /DNA_START= /DNA_END= /DNA_ORIENTATION=